MTPAEKLLDARDLEPPEPLELTLAALDELQPDQRLRLLLPREPYPLYGILDRNGYQHETERHPDGYFAILIWR
jgi:uncharacterized protein (DUF2249 family)